jgi:hypothetical protein
LSKIHIKPALGKKVRKADTKMHLAEAGEEVEKSPYWNRRLKAGDVVLVEQIQEEKPEVKAEKQVSKQGDKQ